MQQQQVTSEVGESSPANHNVSQVMTNTSCDNNTDTEQNMPAVNDDNENDNTDIMSVQSEGFVVKSYSCPSLFV